MIESHVAYIHALEDVVLRTDRRKNMYGMSKETIPQYVVNDVESRFDIDWSIYNLEKTKLPANIYENLVSKQVKIPRETYLEQYLIRGVEKGTSMLLWTVQPVNVRPTEGV